MNVFTAHSPNRDRSTLAFRLLGTLAILLGFTAAPVSGQSCPPTFGPSLAFDGIDDRVTIPANDVLNGAADFTIEAWVNVSSQPTVFSTLIVKQANGLAVRPFLLSIFQGVVHCSINYDPASGLHALHINGTTNLLGGWRHLAWRRSNGIVQVLIDGVVETFDGGSTALLVPALMAAENAPIQFGDEPYTQRLSGRLDEVRIWSIARSTAEIAGNMGLGLNGNESGLVAYWRLDDGLMSQVVRNDAVATGTALDGALGTGLAIEAMDPAWSFASPSPVTYCAAFTGNVGVVGGSGPFDVLSLNGSAGGSHRRVDVAVNAPITISISQPPTSSAPAAFVLYGLIGVPAPSDAVALPLGIGTMAFMPYTLNPNYAGAFQVASSFQPDPVSLVAGTLTPWSYTKITGIHFPFQMTFQGVMLTYPATFEVTNGVILNVQ